MASVYQLRVGAVSGGKNFWQIVMHYRLSEGGAGDPIKWARGLLTAWLAAMDADLRALLSSDTTVNLIDAKKVTNGGGPSIAQTINEVGTAGATVASTVIAVDLAFYPGGLANRPGHQYMGGVPNDAIFGDTIQAGYHANMDTYATDLLVQLTLPSSLGTAALTTFSKKTNTDTLVTDYDIRPKVTAMNKRTLPVT